jgi:hypothetical protein
MANWEYCKIICYHYAIWITYYRASGVKGQKFAFDRTRFVKSGNLTMAIEYLPEHSGRYCQVRECSVRRIKICCCGFWNSHHLYQLLNF